MAVTSAASSMVVDSTAWGPTLIDRVDLQLLAAGTGLPESTCLEKLRTYRLKDMADEWTRLSPQTPDEVRQFYSDTSLYLWELLTWNGSEAYASYLNKLERLSQIWPPAEYPAVLDYGCGV